MVDPGNAREFGCSASGLGQDSGLWRMRVRFRKIRLPMVKTLYCEDRIDQGFHFLSPLITSSLDALKVSALYFPTINLETHHIYQSERLMSSGNMSAGRILGIIDFPHERFLKETQCLSDADVLNPSDPLTDKGMSDPDHQVRARLSEAFSHALYDQVSDRILSQSEMHEVYWHYFGPLRTGVVVRYDFLYRFYASLFVDLLMNGFRRSPSFGDSRILPQLLASVLPENKSKTVDLKTTGIADLGPNIVQCVLGPCMADLASIEFEDVLELRHKLRNELEAFHTALQQVVAAITSREAETLTRDSLFEMVTTTVRTALDVLHTECSASQSKVSRRFAAIVKDPTRRIPITFTAIKHVPKTVFELLDLNPDQRKRADEVLRITPLSHRNGLYILLDIPTSPRRRGLEAKSRLWEGSRTADTETDFILDCVIYAAYRKKNEGTSANGSVSEDESRHKTRNDR